MSGFFFRSNRGLYCLDNILRGKVKFLINLFNPYDRFSVYGRRFSNLNFYFVSRSTFLNPFMHVHGFKLNTPHKMNVSSFRPYKRQSSMLCIIAVKFSQIPVKSRCRQSILQVTYQYITNIFSRGAGAVGQGVRPASGMVFESQLKQT